MIQPPTDNLYKFIAIAGLIIIFISAVIPIEDLRSLSDERKALESYFDRAKRILESQTAESATFDKIKQDSDRSLAPLVVGSIPPAGKEAAMADIRKITAQLRDSALAMHQNNEASSRLLAEYKEKERALKIRLERIDENFPRDTARTILGIVLTIFGFRRWYTKLQRYQDALVRYEAVSKGLFSEDHDRRGFFFKKKPGPPPAAAP